MKRWWHRWFQPRRIVFSHVEDFGPRLRVDQVLQLLRGKKESEHFRMIMQLLEFQRQLCQIAVQDKTNVLNGQTAFEAGGAASVQDVMVMIGQLEQGGKMPSDLAAWFKPAVTQPESDKMR